MLMRSGALPVGVERLVREASGGDLEGYVLRSGGSVYELARNLACGVSPADVETVYLSGARDLRDLVERVSLLLRRNIYYRAVARDVTGDMAVICEIVPMTTAVESAFVKDEVVVRLIAALEGCVLDAVRLIPKSWVPTGEDDPNLVALLRPLMSLVRTE